MRTWRESEISLDSGNRNLHDRSVVTFFQFSADRLVVDIKKGSPTTARGLFHPAADILSKMKK